MSLNKDDLNALFARIWEAPGGDPDYLIVHPDTYAKILVIEERRKHWYWRLFYRIRGVFSWIRYAPHDLRFWWRIRWADWSRARYDRWYRSIGDDDEQFDDGDD